MPHPQPEAGLQLTRPLLKRYQKDLQSRGYLPHTVEMYLCCLHQLYAFLPDGKWVTKKDLRRWTVQMKAAGLSESTIRLRFAALNSFLRFCGCTRQPIPSVPVPFRTGRPGLSIDEYERLLNYTRMHGCRRDVLLIRTLATLDLPLTKLSLLRVESCRKGVVVVKPDRRIRLPDVLRSELLTYCDSEGMQSGPIFASRNGQGLDRSNITHRIHRLGVAAGLAPEKCNPAALHRFGQEKETLSL